MKAVVQVVGKTELVVDNKTVSKIEKGMVVYFCVEKGDLEEKLSFFAKKLANLRIFKDKNDKTNLSIKEIEGEIMLVSQFTLAGDCEHGNRPSFFSAADPEIAERFYIQLSNILTNVYGLNVKLGVFGADMTIKQTNLGPFTIVLEK